MKTPLEQLEDAEETFLEAFGWVQGRKLEGVQFWRNEDDFSYVLPQDQAIARQKAILYKEERLAELKGSSNSVRVGCSTNNLVE